MTALLFINYFAIYFLATSMGGNKFINCTLIGVGELMGGLVAGYALTIMKDNIFFMLSSSITCLANFVFYAVPVGFPQYLCLLLFVMGAAANLTTIFVLAELRTPSEHSGSVLVLMATLGTCAAAISPSIGAAGYPMTMIIPGMLSAFNLGLSFLVGAPGKYLPKAKAVSDNVTHLKTANLSYSLKRTLINCNATFDLTYHERIHGVQRPRLNETNVDPRIIAAVDDDIGRSFSRVLQNWDMGSNEVSRDCDLSLLHKYGDATSLMNSLETRDWN